MHRRGVPLERAFQLASASEIVLALLATGATPCVAWMCRQLPLRVGTGVVGAYLHGGDLDGDGFEELLGPQGPSDGDPMFALRGILGFDIRWDDRYVTGDVNSARLVASPVLR